MHFLTNLTGKILRLKPILSALQQGKKLDC